MKRPSTIEILAQLGDYFIGPNEYDELWDEVERETEIGGGHVYRHSDYYDRDGNPISMRQWSMLRQWSAEHDNQYIRVAQDTIGPYWVSTVWIGLNHRFVPGPPWIFETMVFNQEKGGSDVDEMNRYSTEAEALQGHQEIVERVRILHAASEGLDPGDEHVRWADEEDE